MFEDITRTSISERLYQKSLESFNKIIPKLGLTGDSCACLKEYLNIKWKEIYEIYEKNLGGEKGIEDYINFLDEHKDFIDKMTVINIDMNKILITKELYLLIEEIKEIEQEEI